MSTTKIVGLKAILDCDVAGGTSYTTATLVSEMTPPPRSHSEVQALALGETLDVPEIGIEEASEFLFTHWWEAGDTEHERFDTIFDSQADAQWRITYPHLGVEATDQPYADTFKGKVRRLAPAAINPTSVISRQVMVRRTGAIARATYTVS